MPESGKLERVVIKAYDNPQCSDPPSKEFQAYVNPSEVTVAYEIEYNEAQGSGSTGARMDFKAMKPGELSLAFFLDGTGANGRTLEVQKEVEKFRDVTGYRGKIHRTTYLKVAWGKLLVARCVLKSASIAYKLFTADGVPLRAVITAVFKDAFDDKTRVAFAQDKSPDLTHVRVVKAGDNLPALCDEIYGDPRLYVQVAMANGLDDLRALRPGTRLRFPPLEK